MAMRSTLPIVYPSHVYLGNTRRRSNWLKSTTLVSLCFLGYIFFFAGEEHQLPYRIVTLRVDHDLLFVLRFGSICSGS
jgi:hypothetical protein